MYASVPMIGLTPWRPARLVEVEDPVHVAVIGDAERRLPVGHGLGHQLVEPRRTVEHRELGVDVEVGERIPHWRTPFQPTSTRLDGARHASGELHEIVIPAPSLPTGRCKVRAGPIGQSSPPGGLSHAGPPDTRRAAATHPLELLTGSDLLGEQRGLDAVEQALQPADELGLGDAELAVGRDLAVLERQGQHCSSSCRSGDSASDSSTIERS